MKLIYEANEIPTIRKLLGISQTAMAKTLGVSRTTYFEREREGNFWLKEVVVITKIFNDEAKAKGLTVPIDWLHKNSV